MITLSKFFPFAKTAAAIGMMHEVLPSDTLSNSAVNISSASKRKRTLSHVLKDQQVSNVIFKYAINQVEENQVRKIR